MRRAQLIAIFALTLGCQPPEGARLPEQRDPGPGGAVGWTIEETMKIRNIDQVRISPDGRRVLFAAKAAVLSGDKGEYHTRIHTAGIDGTNERPLTGNDYSAFGPEWSPDGRWVAFAADRSGKKAGPTLWLIPADGGTPHTIDVGGTGVATIGWSPDSRSIAFTMPTPASAAQQEALAHEGAPQVVGADLRRLQIWIIGIAPDGAPRDRARALSPDTLNIVAMPEFGPVFDWSPDASAIVYAAGRAVERFPNLPGTGIAITEITSGRTRSLVPGAALAPKFSPDGRSVAFVATTGWHPQHPADVAIIEAAGGTPRRLARTTDRRPGLVGWSADGEQVYVSEPRRTVTRLSALPVSGDSARDLDPGDAVLGAFALHPSRTMVAFTRQTLTQPIEVYVSRLDGFASDRVSHVNSALPGHLLPRTEIVQWHSVGGAEIEGLLTYPMEYRQGQRYPLVLVVRSGGVAFQQTFVANPFMSDQADYYPVTEFALHGYAVLQCNCRGSGLPGYGPAYAAPMGVVREAYDDVMSGVDRVISLGIADSARVGITGLSYGGLVAAWTITQTKRFKAAIINAGTYDQVAAAPMNPSAVFTFGVQPWENPAPFVAHSPSTYVGRVVTPTLVLIGERDPLVSVSQGYNLHYSLQRLGVASEMVIYPGEGHPVLAPKHLVDIGKRHLAWMGRYLAGER